MDTDKHRYDDEEWLCRTRAAYQPGMDFNAYFLAYTAALPSASQRAWQRTTCIAFCAKESVRNQLEWRFNELKVGN